MPTAKKIRTELERLGTDYEDARESLEDVEGELAKWLALAQDSSDLTVSEAARLAKLTSRPLFYKILRRAGSGRT